MKEMRFFFFFLLDWVTSGFSNVHYSLHSCIITSLCNTDSYSSFFFSMIFKICIAHILVNIVPPYKIVYWSSFHVQIFCKGQYSSIFMQMFDLVKNVMIWCDITLVNILENIAYWKNIWLHSNAKYYATLQ